MNLSKIGMLLAAAILLGALAAPGHAADTERLEWLRKFYRMVGTWEVQADKLLITPRPAETPTLAVNGQLLKAPVLLAEGDVISLWWEDRYYEYTLGFAIRRRAGMDVDVWERVDAEALQEAKREAELNPSSKAWMRKPRHLQMGNLRKVQSDDFELPMTTTTLNGVVPVEPFDPR